MTDYKAIAASLRACADPQKRHAADVIDELLALAGQWRDTHSAELAEARIALRRCIEEIQPQHIPGDVYTQAQAALAGGVTVSERAIGARKPDNCLIEAALGLREASGALLYGLAKALDISHHALRSERDAVLGALHELDRAFLPKKVAA